MTDKHYKFYIQRFTIPGRLSTRNELDNAYKRNRHVGSNLKRSNDEKVAWNSQGLEKIKGKSDFDITFFCKDKRTDPDNIQSGAIKCILDGLQLSNKLSGDGWNQVGRQIFNFKIDKKNPRVEVIIKERI